MLVQLFNAVLYSSIAGAIVAAVILILKLVFKKSLGAGWHYWIWFILVLRLLMPVSLGSPFSLFSAVNMPDRSDIAKTYTVVLSPTAAANTADNSTAIHTASAVHPGDPAIPLSSMPAIVWASIAAGLLIYMAAGYAAFAIKVRRLPRCDDERAVRIFNECKSTLDVRRNVGLAYMRSNKSPALTGLIHPVVIISPVTASGLGDNDLRNVFMHELSHLKHHDILAGLLITAAEILHWFNPVALICLHLMKQDREVACDSLALSRLEPDERRPYGQTIISLCEMYSRPGLRPWVTGIAGKGEIKRRIVMIVNFKKASAIGTCAAIMLSMLVGCSALTDKNAAAGKSGAASASSSSASSNQTVSSTDSGSSGSSTASNASSSSSSSNGTLSLSAFSPIKSIVSATLYETNKETSAKVSGSYDLNGDGTKENISINSKPAEQDGTTTIKVGSGTISKQLYSMVGVYVVKLNKSDKFSELVVVESSTDDDVYAHFYKYGGNGSTLKELGEIYGSFDGTAGAVSAGFPYNSGILVDGSGHIIPRLGIMCYVSPQIMLSCYELNGDKIGQVKLDLSNALNKKYTLTQDVTPYFEPMASMPKGYELTYDTSKVITVKKGSTVTFKIIGTSMEDSFCSLATLSNGKTGLLYFYVHP